MRFLVAVLIGFSQLISPASAETARLTFIVQGTHEVDIRMEDTFGTQIDASHEAVSDSERRVTFEIEGSDTTDYLESFKILFSGEGFSTDIGMLLNRKRKLNAEIFLDSDTLYQEFSFQTSQAWDDLAVQSPLSFFLLTQRLKQRGTFDIGSDTKAFLAFIEYLSAYRLACGEPRGYLFQLSAEQVAQLTVAEIVQVKGGESNEAGSIDSNQNADWIDSWNLLRISTDEVQSNFFAIPACSWAQYRFVAMERKDRRIKEALLAFNFFVSQWDEQTEEMKVLVASRFGVNSSRLANDGEFLRNASRSVQ